ncbi:MAG: AzlC family ABC transporter permease [Thermodesulfobacteriota bacterium]
MTQTTAGRASRRPGAFREGVTAAWPVFLGYLPIGLAFGVLAQKIGLSPFHVGLMSLLVFAGSSQFIAVSMLAAGAGCSAVVATTFVVNLRHLLMSSAMAPHLGSAGQGWLAVLAHGITDESFAVNHARFSRGGWNWRSALAVNQSTCAVWVASTMAGAWAGRFIPEGAFGIDYALIAMFLCLLVFQLRARRHVVAACVAGGLAVVLSLVFSGNGYIIIATVAAATAVTFVNRRVKGNGDRRREGPNTHEPGN